MNQINWWLVYILQGVQRRAKSFILRKGRWCSKKYFKQWSTGLCVVWKSQGHSAKCRGQKGVLSTWPKPGSLRIFFPPPELNFSTSLRCWSNAICFLSAFYVSLFSGAPCRNLRERSRCRCGTVTWSHPCFPTGREGSSWRERVSSTGGGRGKRKRIHLPYRELKLSVSSCSHLNLYSDITWPRWHNVVTSTYLAGVLCL